MVTFNSVILDLERMGMSDVIIPFILIFAISFAVMQKVRLFSKKKEDGKYTDVKKYHAALSLVFSLATVIPHVTNSYPRGFDVVVIINNALPQVSVVIVGLVCLLILMSSLGFNLKMGKDKPSPFALILWSIALLTVGYIFATSAGVAIKLPKFLQFLNNSDTQVMILIIVGFGLIINYIMSPEKKKPYIDENGKYKAGHYKDTLNKRYKDFMGFD